MRLSCLPLMHISVLEYAEQGQGSNLPHSPMPLPHRSSPTLCECSCHGCRSAGEGTPAKVAGVPAMAAEADGDNREAISSTFSVNK